MLCMQLLEGNPSELQLNERHMLNAAFSMQGFWFHVIECSNG